MQIKYEESSRREIEINAVNEVDAKSGLGSNYSLLAPTKDNHQLNRHALCTIERKNKKAVAL